MWTWRLSQTITAHRQIQRQPARLWASASLGRLSLSLGSQTLLTASQPPSRLHMARLDGDQISLIFESRDGARRDLRLRQARLNLTDTAIQPIHWQLPRDWIFTAEENGFIGKGPPQSPQMIIKLDPAWKWSLQGTLLSGQGQGKASYSIEMR